MKKLLYILLAALPLFMACNKEDNGGTTPTPPPPAKTDYDHLIGIWAKADYSEIYQDSVYEILGFELDTKQKLWLRRELIIPSDTGWMRVNCTNIVLDTTAKTFNIELWNANYGFWIDEKIMGYENGRDYILHGYLLTGLYNLSNNNQTLTISDFKNIVDDNNYIQLKGGVYNKITYNEHMSYVYKSKPGSPTKEGREVKWEY